MQPLNAENFIFPEGQFSENQRVSRGRRRKLLAGTIFACIQALSARGGLAR